MPLLPSIVAVAIGGAIGTAARAVLEASIEQGWALLLVNALGSGLLGLSVAALADAPAWLRHGAGAGVLGGFTTFSGVAVASVALSAAGAGWSAVVPALPGIAFALAALLSALAAAWAGLALGRRLARSRAR
ncbi:CrcB family protein [Agrococcus sp. HG114]|uniref:fluoride efflux transporter FluC n=1 Tax=Agrococcus sp. HG114 TaxID=2969757 RepID=UPI00215B543C|nr:CrcB family protein [Agrococcus sp. HG114]MCR8671049.1 CrcB family protein [Agrococcus sp. HG114]